MAKRRKKKRKSPIPILISLIVAVLIVIVIALFFNKYSGSTEKMSASSYFGIQAGDEAALIVNGEKLDEKGKVVNGKIYVDFTTAWNYLNSGFYYDSNKQQLLLTLPSGTLTWTEDDGSGNLIMIDGTPYISAECIRDNSDIDLTTYSDPNRLVARNEWEDVKTASVTEDTEVRYRGGPKSAIITEVKKGASVVVNKEMDSWTEIATEEGYVGYVKNSSISVSDKTGIEHTTDEKYVFPKADTSGEKICLAWHYMSNSDVNNTLQQVIQNASGLNTISPTWFAVTDNSGTLRSYASKSYVDQAHAAGLSVWAHFGDVDTDSQSADPATFFADSTARSGIISQLMSAADATGFDGINLDFESLSEESLPQYLQFIRELCVAAHQKNLVISVDNFVPSYTKYYKRAEQAKCADYIVIMGYDEYNSTSEEPGPVASISFVEQGIQDTLAEVSKEQVINAVPFYTRGWTEKFGSSVPQSETLGMDEADSFVSEHGIELSFDEDVGENYGTAETSDARYSIWMEDETALEEKMKLIKEYDLAGVGAWRLGYERSSVWNIIQKYLS